MSKKKGNEGQAENVDTATVEGINPAQYASTAEALQTLQSNGTATSATPAIVESKSAKFERLAQDRFGKMVARIRQLGALSNKSQYEYTQERVYSMFAAMQKEIEDAKARYSGKLPAEKASKWF